MNILELIAKAHPQVRVERREGGDWQAVPDARSLVTKVQPERGLWQRLRGAPAGRPVRGLRMAPGMRLVVREAARHWPGYVKGEGTLYLQAPGGQPAPVRLAWLEGDRAAGEATLAAGAQLEAVHPPATASRSADLVVEVPEGGAPVFLGVHQVLDRSPLIARCRGRGVEIGPGPKPQVLPGSGVDVSYVEQATPEDWVRLYGKDTKMPVDPGLWKRYVVGNADRIPAEPGSLDFIFSSHVVEHLANPLGHLAYWSTLLRPGGIVAAVIPDLEGCKDFVFRPSAEEELAGEWSEGGMDVKLRHYERWAEHRASGRDPVEIMASGRSIHVHFYTADSMREVLRRHHRGLGYRRWDVISSPNHKDFHVLLEK